MRRRGSLPAIFLFLAGVLIVGLVFPVIADVAYRFAGLVAPQIQDPALQEVPSKIVEMLPYLPLFLLVLVFVWALSEAHRRERREYPEEY